MRRDVFARGGAVEFNALAILVVILFVRLLFVEIRSIREDPRNHPFIHSSSSKQRDLSDQRINETRTRYDLATSFPENERSNHSEELLSSSSDQKHEDDEDDYTSTGVYTDDDDDEGALARIERAIVAPVHLIGSIPNLKIGHTLKTAVGKEQRSFPQGSIVLITHLGNDFYRGYIINLPLPEAEQVAAQSTLRIANENTQAQPPRLDSVVFYGNGGPVRTVEERWSIIHDQPQAIDGATVLGESLALGGDLQQILSSKTIHIVLLYGTAVWIPGQLEREIKDGVWSLSEKRVTKFDDLLGHCFSAISRNR